MQIGLRIPRPDHVNLRTQGQRGPFAPLIIALEAMTQIDEWLLQQERFPLLYDSGVVYHTEPPGIEELVSYDVVLERGWGDCGHLAPIRTAELRNRRIAARCCIKWKWVDSVMLVHVMTMWPDGTIEDPSKILGMPGEYS